MTDTHRAIDGKTISEVRELFKQAKAQNMEVDWETATLVPKKLATMTPHQRDLYVSQQMKQEYCADLRSEADNDPASPEQAWA